MAFETYTELKGAVADWLARTDLTNRIPDFVRLAEMRIQQELKLRYLETTISGTMTAGVSTIALPADCLEPISLRITTSPPSTLVVSAPDVMTRFEGDLTSRPKRVSHRGLTLWIAPVPDSNYPYSLTYHARIVPLGTMVGVPPSSTETNWLTQNAANLLLYGALLESSPFIANDERIPVWAGLFDRCIVGVRTQNWRAQGGGGPITVQSDQVA